MTLKKSDIAKNISSRISIKNSMSKDIVNSFIEIIKSKSDSSMVKISNFGTFINKVTPERIGRNPSTGKEYIITERVKLNFTISDKVKKQLN
tara:strand:- start:54 stop:329 length:276 start_codon:yes stop_codon:yes gene_type:complete